jgi:hypothetical protein
MNLQIYLMGVSTAGFLVVALFFLRFWSRTKDQLFSSFAAAFTLLAVERFLLVYLAADEPRTFVYIIRLVAFLILGIAIVRKNREA